MGDVLSPIAAARRPAAGTALAAAFGAAPVTRLEVLKGGVSGAGIYRLEVGDRSYVLRVEPERIALEHRERHFACMAAAAGVGVAPPVHYADAASGFAVMDFIEGRPLSEHPGGPAGLVQDLGLLIARLQATPPFPMLGDGRDVIEMLLGRLEISGLFAAGLLESHREGLARIRAVRPWNPRSLVSSHNDPNPRNMLFDGARLWLIDWELGFRHDPLFDLAILTTGVAATPELEGVLMGAGLGREPDAAVRAQLAVTRLLTRLFYGCIVLDVFTADPRFAPDPGLDALTPAEFRAAVADGRLGWGAAETAYAFGKMSLRAFLDGLAAPGFAHTLALAKQG